MPQRRRINVDVISFVSRQLPYHAPMLLLYMVGVVISLTYLKRFAAPAALALASCALLFVMTLALPFIEGYLIEALNEARGELQQIQRQMLLLRVASTLLRVTAFGLLLAAVFSGRSPSAESPYNPGITTAGQVHHPSLQAHRAALVLVLGILSLIVCAPLGIAAWIMGGNDLSAMRSGKMDPSGESLTTAGRNLGIIGTVLFGLGVVAACVWFATVPVFLQDGR